MGNLDEDKFVTFKWLIGSILSVVLIMGTFTTIIITVLSGRFEAKLDKSIFDIQTKGICEDLNELKNDVKAMDRLLRSSVVVKNPENEKPKK